MKTPFFRITKSAAHGLDKETALRRSVASWRTAALDVLAHDVDPRDFEKFDESPFAYWLPDQVRTSLVAQPALKPTHADVRQGLATADDPRFLRLWFEVPAVDVARTRDETCQQKRWAGFAKGGTFAPFFSDIMLLINWESDGREIRNFYGSDGKLKSRPQSLEYCFRPGLTYPLRAETLNVRVLPRGCAFGHKGPSIFANDEAELLTLLGILNSSMSKYCSELRSPRADSFAGGMSKSFEVGSVQKLPIPKTLDGAIGDRALALFELHRRAARFRETTHDFVAPLFATAPTSLRVSWDFEVAYQTGEHATRAAALKAQLDERVFDLYRISAEDRAVILADVAQSGVGTSGTSDATDGDEDEQEQEVPDADVVEQSPQVASEALLSYAVGCAFGRWDVRIGREPGSAPALGSPFESLPRCSPGMLVGSDGLPATQKPPAYPVDFPPDGVLVDDKDHPRDIARLVRDAFVALYGGAADERLAEALAMAGATDGDLRAWLRTRFFERVHRSMYTMGGNPPRRAPLYWPIYTKARRGQLTFGVWLYYPRLTQESLFTIARILKDRRESEGAAVNRLADAVSDAKGREARDAKDAKAQSEELVGALRELEEEALRVANLRVVPEFDDGVVLNCAVLHKLVSWADAKAAWTKLQNGGYDWSNIAKKLRPAESDAFQARERTLAEAAANKTKKPKAAKPKRERKA